MSADHKWGDDDTVFTCHNGHSPELFMIETEMPRLEAHVLKARPLAGSILGVIGRQKIYLKEVGYYRCVL